MNEFEIVFEKNFAEYKDVPIAIYGLGVNAERIVTNVHGFDFMCLVAIDHIGEELYGLPICSIYEALPKVKAIIIAATPKIKKIIYERIKDIVPENIVILDVWGNRLKDQEEISNNPYWKKSYEELKNEIDMHDVISFDMFDTLVMRKALNVENFFEYLEITLNKRGYNYPFKEMRIVSEKEALKEMCSPHISQIYEYMRKIYDLDLKSMEEMMKCEIESEIQNLVPRISIKELYNYAKSIGKTVLIISDTYYDRKIFIDILKKSGLKMPDALYVSCELDKTKEKGTLYSVFEKYEGKRLHVGDNYLTDYEIPKGKGIDTYYIMNGMDMVRNSTFYHIENNIEGAVDRLLLGRIIADMCNDPFTLNKHKGKIAINDGKSLGKYCIGGVTLSFMGFLLDKLSGKDCEVLFASRDGYYFHKIYENRVKKQIKGLPRSHYFYTSRNAMCSATVKNIDILKKYLEGADYKYSIQLFFSERFGVNLPDEYAISFQDAKDNWGDNWVEDKVGAEFDKYFNSQKRCCKSLMNYYEKLGIDKKKQIQFIDLVTKGTCVYGLRQIVNQSANLIALGGIEIPNSYLFSEDAECLYGKNAKVTEFYQWFTLLELLLASTEGKCVGYEETGKPILDENSSYDEDLLNDVQNGMDELCDLLDEIGWDRCRVNKDFAEDLLKILDTSYSEISEILVEKFTDDDKLWDPEEPDKTVNILMNLR